MPNLMTSELRSDLSTSCYTTARLVGEACTDDIVSKSARKSGALVSQTTSSSSEDNRFKNTRMCVFFQKGACTKGANCTYAHSTDQLKRAPNLLKTRLCQDWLNGRCVTPDCRFAHGRQELRFTFDYYKTKLCHFWQNGGCTKGTSCRHAHGEHELRPMPPEVGDGGTSSSSASTADEVTPEPDLVPLPSSSPGAPELASADALAAMAMCADLLAPHNAHPAGTSAGQRPGDPPPPPRQRRSVGHAKARPARGAVANCVRDAANGPKPTRGAKVQPPGKQSGMRSAAAAGSRSGKMSDTDNLVKAMRLAQAARELANKSNDLLRKVVENEALDVSYLLPLSQSAAVFDNRSAFKSLSQTTRHSVACPVGVDTGINAAAFSEERAEQACSRLWDQRHSAPECDLESLAEKLIPLLTGPEELHLTAKICQSPALTHSCATDVF